MEAQMRRAPGEEVHHIVAGEEQDVGHEKKSVLMKVKDKAKKIKSKITPKHHAHDGHDHDHDHQYHNHHGAQSDEEDYDEGESIEPDPEVHGAPIYESRDVKRIGDVDEISGKTRGNHLGTSDLEVGLEDDSGKSTPKRKVGDQVFGQSNLEEREPKASADPHETSRPEKYQIQVADPKNKGGGEVDKVGPVTDNLGHTRISQSGPTGSRDQFAPEPSADNTPYNDANKRGPVPKYPDQPDQAQPASYKEKISAATSSIATTVVSAKDAIAEKLGYGHKDDQHSSGDGKPASSPGEHGQKMKEILAPVYVKVTEVGSAVASKMSGASKTGESQGQAGDKVRVEETEGGVKKVGSGGQTVPEYLTDKLGSGGEDRSLSEVVSDVLHKRKDVQDEVTVDESGHRHETCERWSGSGEGGGVAEGIIGTVASYFNKGGEASDAYGTHISGGPQESSHENRNHHEQRISASAN